MERSYMRVREYSCDENERLQSDLSISIQTNYLIISSYHLVLIFILRTHSCSILILGTYIWLRARYVFNTPLQSQWYKKDVEIGTKESC
jgi:hypothetical protein